MLAEAVAIMRQLWEGGVVSHEGDHYTVESARIYTLPEEPPPVVVSGFGPRAAALAGEIGDGYMNVSPSAELLEEFHRAGGRGKPAYGKLDVCVAATVEEARATAYRTWPNSPLPGELAQILPTPAHFEQAVSLVTEDMVAESITCTVEDPEPHVEKLREFADAGYDHVIVQQAGPEQDRFIDFFSSQVLPRARG
jgi:G6PDH family F420-dependent oxidoreductase